MKYYAHSPKKNIPAQSYLAHVQGVVEQAKEFAQEIQPYTSLSGDLLHKIVNNASIFHDLGKLCPDNQLVLSAQKIARTLPKNHVDAGTAYLLNGQQLSPYAAVLTHGHHIGLPNFIEEQNRGESAFRDNTIMAENDQLLSTLVELHKELILCELLPEQAELFRGDLSVFLRLALSCLVDADHTNTAIHYNQYPKIVSKTLLRAKERLASLDDYIAKLKKDDSERTLLRNEMYTACRDADIATNICSCDSPVGYGSDGAFVGASC